MSEEFKATCSKCSFWYQAGPGRFSSKKAFNEWMTKTKGWFKKPSGFWRCKQHTEEK